MYHKLIIAGHLGTDPEMRYTPEGTPVTSFRMASNIRYRDASGEQREETIWFRVSVFGRQAEIANQYLQKGRPVLVEGRVEGYIAFEPRGSSGFGYDPIFYIPELGKTMAELPMEVKNRISHRARAARKAREILERWLREEACEGSC